jgi:hypothetical protein
MLLLLGAGKDQKPIFAPDGRPPFDYAPSPCQLAGTKNHKEAQKPTKRKGTDDGWLLGR